MKPESPPNLRLQRTRFAPLRSPLSRQPLGGTDGSHHVIPRAATLAVAPFLVLALFGSGSQPSQEPQKYVAKPSDFRIVCTLFNGDPPGKVSVADIPITYDPLFLVGARIEAVTLGTSPWKVGSFVRFTIHSPTLLFGGQRFDRQKFTMTFSPFRPHGKDDEVWFKPETRYLLRWIEKASEASPNRPA